ncbi:MAG: TetR/AcrR family transcriptional regulator [Anaerolineae bacterium]|nr:TetR/AcrR family transcriptional regulator [Anaerolineae bacterium]
MGRSKEFDPKETLHAAMELFWRKGYLNTSIDDLVEHTGVSRYGLYGAFGTKHELFLKALDYYRTEATALLFGRLEAEESSLEAVRWYFDLMSSGAGSEAGMRGCMISNTALEIAPFDPEAAERVAMYFDRLKNAFYHALHNAQQDGSLPGDFDVAAYAGYLVGVSQGLTVFLRSSVQPEAVQQYVQVALAALPA